MSKVKGKGPASPVAVPPTIMTEKASTYAFGTVVAGAVMVAAAAWMGGSLATIDERIQDGFDAFAKTTGFTVKQVHIEGLGPRAKADVINELEKIEIRFDANMFRADPHIIKDTVSSLESVSDVMVLRHWPDTVRVLAEPRTPLALWQSSGQWVVIDQKGEPLLNADPNEFTELPRVVGPHGGTAAPALLSRLALEPDFAGQVEIALRVGGRRWDLRLHSGVEIAMPEDERFTDALGAVLTLHDETGLLMGEAVRIDARDPARFAVDADRNVAHISIALGEGA